ncbi:MAG TPA: hypothetical protein VI957_02910 [Candidatus Paceibacterota bacterium]
MAEIFRPTFGGKKPIVQTLERSGVPNPRPNEEIMAAFVSDVKFFTDNPQIIKNAVIQWNTITDYIFSLANFKKNDANVDLRRDTLQGTSLEQLCSYLLSTSENDWRARPSFYGAVILEMNLRLKRMGAVNNDLHE